MTIGAAAPQMRQIETTTEDVVLLSVDLASFAIACIIGGTSHEAAVMTANNLIGREIESYANWKKSKVLIDPLATGQYLSQMHIRIFDQFVKLAAANVKPIETQVIKEGEENGTGKGN